MTNALDQRPQPLTCCCESSIKKIPNAKVVNAGCKIHGLISNYMTSRPRGESLLPNNPSNPYYHRMTQLA